MSVWVVSGEQRSHLEGMDYVWDLGAFPELAVVARRGEGDGFGIDRFLGWRELRPRKQL
jgi:hypothetical protein